MLFFQSGLSALGTEELIFINQIHEKGTYDSLQANCVCV